MSRKKNLAIYLYFNYISTDELWIEYIENKYCSNHYEPVERVHDQLECQLECDHIADCIGISFSHSEGSGTYCYICTDDTLQDAYNGLGFYRKPHPCK